MKHLLSIGKFAALCNTTTDTLIHYDQLGLLKPSHFTAGNRRMYDIQQYHNFRLIQALADMGTPLQEINSLMQTETVSARIKKLQAKELKLKQQLQYLQKTILYTQSLHFLSGNNMSLPARQPSIYNYSTTRPLFSTPLPCPPETISDLSQAVQIHISQCTIKQIHPFPLGILVQRRDRGLPHKKHLLITSPVDNHTLDNQCIQRLPGDYATAYHCGSLLTLKQSVDMLYDYIHSNHYEIGGDTFITLYDNGSPQKWEPIYQIEILIFKN